MMRMLSISLSSNRSVLLSRRLSLGDGLAHDVSPLLLLDHDLEAVKVRQTPPLLSRLPLLRPRGLVPLVDESLLLDDLLHDGGAGSKGESDLEGREGEVLEGEGLAGDRGGRAVDDCL